MRFTVHKLLISENRPSRSHRCHADINKSTDRQFLSTDNNKDNNRRYLRETRTYIVCKTIIVCNVSIKNKSVIVFLYLCLKIAQDSSPHYDPKHSHSRDYCALIKSIFSTQCAHLNVKYERLRVYGLSENR